MSSAVDITYELFDTEGKQYQAETPGGTRRRGKKESKEKSFL